MRISPGETNIICTQLDHPTTNPDYRGQTRTQPMAAPCRVSSP
jgi:hypothetical protein